MKEKEEIKKIDFVILWVDQKDINWQKEKLKYSASKCDDNINRYRDSGIIKYLFRSIEKYASWGNNIYFITYGHIPEWLNTDNEKIKIVKHEEFIPKEYLPTFNSNVIELNLHRIENLSENFVLFNDDLVILNFLKENDFFEKGLPKDVYVETTKKNPSKRHIIMRKNYIELVNKHYIKKEMFWKNIFKIFNFKYRSLNFETLRLLKKNEYVDFLNLHLTQSFLKSTFKQVWKLESTRLDLACKNRFRSDTDIGTAICRYIQLVSGKFLPMTIKFGKYYSISNDNSILIKDILYGKHKIICINDDKIDIDFDEKIIDIQNALNSKFNEKCSFEK